MGLVTWIIVSILVLTIIILAIAQYAKESKFQKICKRISIFLIKPIFWIIPRNELEEFFER